jgi:hypothetical protein
MSAGAAPVPFVGAIIQLLQEGAVFLRAALLLARAEMTQGLTRLVRGVALGAGAVLCLLLGLVFLLIGLTLFIISRGVAADIAFVGVGGVLLLVFAFLASWARILMRNGSIVPRHAIAELNDTLRAARDTPPRE